VATTGEQPPPAQHASAQHASAQHAPPPPPPPPPGATLERAPAPPRSALERALAARAALSPLAPGERPLALLFAVFVAAGLALFVLTGALTIHDLSRHGGSLPGGVFIAGVLLALALGMYRRRYWALLSFEALLAFQIIVTSLALVVAETWLAASICLLGIGLGGWLFWKLVRVMGRIQATDRR
jgi:hypothetical protein